MSQQKTIREPVSESGIGLHSGQAVNLTFLPAQPNSGIRFRRTDLEGSPEIEAAIENVSETNRSTTLSKGTIKIHTVEHVLASFAGFGIDNVVVELDANEPPIGDGSARTFCRMIQKAGLMPQPEPRQTFAVPAPFQMQAGESEISVFPHDGLKISCTSADKRGRFTQFFTIEVTPETWENELAAARTFCFYEEIEFLIKNGLIRGGSLENAVVIRDDAVLTTEPLRFPEEFVRHKILDILGDLALVGQPITGHIIAIKPSHTANCELARRLRQQLDQKNGSGSGARALTARAPGEKAGDFADEMEQLAAGSGGLGTAEIMEILPHRAPFLMVDRVLQIEGNKIVALKNLTFNEDFFQGHFPGHPIMPGVLQLEAMAQVAGVLLLKMQGICGKIAYFTSAERVKWRKPVRPGDRLVITAEMTKFRGKLAKAKAVCTVDQDVVSEAEITLMLTES